MKKVLLKTMSTQEVEDDNYWRKNKWDNTSDKGGN